MLISRRLPDPTIRVVANESVVEKMLLWRKVRSDKGLKRGSFAQEVPAKHGRPGRPPKYTPLQRSMMEEVMRQYGLTRSRTVLVERNSSIKGVSVITLSAVAKEKGIVFRMGRPTATSTVEEAPKLTEAELQLQAAQDKIAALEAALEAAREEAEEAEAEAA